MSLNSRSVIILYLLLSLWAPFLVQGQEEEFHIGLILASEDRKPVAFATVRLKNYALGVISNEDGSFRLPIELQSYGDSLEISSLGYRDLIIKFSDFVKGKTKIILMDPAIEELEEVIVAANRRRLSVDRIISNALRNIPQNYPLSPYSYIGYYRDYQLIDQEYTNLNEGIIQIYDQGFTKIDYETTEARIIRLRENTEFPRDSTSAVAYDYKTNSKTIPEAFIEGYSGNELIILRIHDAIRNHQIPAFSYVDEFIRDFKNNHQFSKDGLITYQGDLVYKIAITKYDRNIRVRGEIFISADDFAILKMDYRVYRVSTSSFGNKVRSKEKMLYRIVGEYSRSKEMSRYFPNYLSFHNYFEVTPPPIFVPKSLAWDKNKRVFELEFSQPLASEYISRTNNFKLYFYDKRIRLASIAISNDGTKIQLVPRQSYREYELLALINQQEMKKNNFEVRFGRIRDINGNLINSSESIGGEQYREFFVQQLIPDAELPKKEQLMRKDQPIFGNQPQYDGELSKNYWMNTPLKK